MIAELLPYNIFKTLFGDRRKYGKTPAASDADWQKWQKDYHLFYNSTQRGGIGRIVNDWGYRIMRRVDLTGKKTLEIGAGDIQHFRHWNGVPAHYTLADVNQAMLEKAARALSERAIPCEKIILADGASHKLPLDNAVFDVVLSFYSLEHLHPLSSHLEEIARVLKPGGILAGAIPAEGGLAWGLGRLITSRPDLMRAGVNVEKIVCWEHPNLACEVLQGLRRLFTITKLDFSPLFIPLIDCNLTIGFIARKKGEPHA